MLHGEAGKINCILRHVQQYFSYIVAVKYKMYSEKTSHKVVSSTPLLFNSTLEEITLNYGSES